MPIYRYQRCEPDDRCAKCRDGFEVLQSIHDRPLTECPVCGRPVRKQFVPCRVGRSVSSLDDRAREAGFSKLKRLGKGEYQKEY